MRTLVALALLPLLASPLAGCLQTTAAVAVATETHRCVSEPDPRPLPARKRAVFPFRLVYTLDGREQVVEDARICEFKRRSCGLAGRNDMWESRLASGRTRLLIRQLDPHSEYVANPGECAVLMAEPSYRERDTAPWQRVELRVYRHGRLKETLNATDEELAAQGIRIVSFEQWLDASPPAASGLRPAGSR